jgi:hypothetical protein
MNLTLEQNQNIYFFQFSALAPDELSLYLQKTEIATNYPDTIINNNDALNSVQIMNANAIFGPNNYTVSIL